MRNLFTKIDEHYNAGWVRDGKDRGTCWHYTSSRYVPGILRAGELRHPADRTYKAGIWFSTEPFWEIQAKPARDLVIDRPLQMIRGPADMKAQGETPFRFGMCTAKLCPLYAHKTITGEAPARKAFKSVVLLALSAGKVLQALNPDTVDDDTKKQIDYGLLGFKAQEEFRARAASKHYVHPALTLPLTEIEYIERFDGVRWVDCRKQFMNASRILKTKQ